MLLWHTGGVRIGKLKTGPWILTCKNLNIVSFSSSLICFIHHQGFPTTSQSEQRLVNTVHFILKAYYHTFSVSKLKWFSIFVLVKSFILKQT